MDGAVTPTSLARARMDIASASPARLMTATAASRISPWSSAPSPRARRRRRPELPVGVLVIVPLSPSCRSRLASVNVTVVNLQWGRRAMTTILVIGATGHVGRPVAERLRVDGRRVRLLVRDVNRARRLLGNGFDLVRGSIDEPGAVSAAMS